MKESERTGENNKANGIKFIGIFKNKNSSNSYNLSVNVKFYQNTLFTN